MIKLLGVEFHLYGLIIGLAILSGWQISSEYAKRQGIKNELVGKIAWWVIIGGLIGARAYHVIDFWKRYYHFNYLKCLYLWQGGLGIWGGIVGGIIGLIGYNWLGNKTKINFWKLLDLTVIGVPLGQAIGRLGNWINGELYGKNGEPLFLWEAGLNLILFGILWQIGKKKLSTTKNKSITGIYLIGYGLIRMSLENFRAEEIIWRWHEFPVAIIMGIMAVISGSVIIFLREK